MKRANMHLHFENDTANAFNQDINLIVTTSGHYAIPLTVPRQLFHQFERNGSVNITLSAEHSTSKTAIANKLHHQFAHSPPDKLPHLLNSAGNPWSKDEELKNETQLISKNCLICKLYKKPAPKPIVGLPNASRFQELVAMDLKFCKGKIILHLVDHATRLSVSSLVPSKKPDVIIESILTNWISVFGSADQFLSDNGGEFANEKFMEMCVSLNINFKTTSAESLWLNGLIDRQNLILSEMLDKVLEESKCSFEVALTWCTNAKKLTTKCTWLLPFPTCSRPKP